jgi:hypothetical protein
VNLSGVNGNVTMSGCGDDDPDDEGREAAGSNTESVSRRAERRKKENKGENNFQQRKKIETALVFSKNLILASSATEGIHDIRDITRAIPLSTLQVEQVAANHVINRLKGSDGWNSKVVPTASPAASHSRHPRYSRIRSTG